jgi:hypothetical protein
MDESNFPKALSTLPYGLFAMIAGIYNESLVDFLTHASTHMEHLALEKQAFAREPQLYAALHSTHPVPCARLGLLDFLIVCEGREEEPGLESYKPVASCFATSICFQNIQLHLQTRNSTSVPMSVGQRCRRHLSSDSCFDCCIA